MVLVGVLRSLPGRLSFLRGRVSRKARSPQPVFTYPSDRPRESAGRLLTPDRDSPPSPRVLARHRRTSACRPGCESLDVPPSYSLDEPDFHDNARSRFALALSKSLALTALGTIPAPPLLALAPTPAVAPPPPTTQARQLGRFPVSSPPPPSPPRKCGPSLPLRTCLSSPTWSSHPRPRWFPSRIRPQPRSTSPS